MLNDGAPQPHLAANAVFRVTKSAQVTAALAGVDPARTIESRSLVAAVSSALGREPLARMPFDAIQGFQARPVPLPPL